MKPVTKLGYAFLLAIMIGLSGCGANHTQKAETENQPAPAELAGTPRQTVVRPDENGTLVLTAEKGLPVGPSIKYMPEFKAYGWFRNQDRVEWLVDVKTAAAYTATLEWSVSDEEAGKEFALESDNAKITGIVEKSGSWETFKTANIGTIELPAGQQKIVFKPNEDFDSTKALLDLRQITLQVKR